MIAIICIFLWTYLGILICKKLLNFSYLKKTRSLFNTNISINKYLFYLPAGYLVGSLITNYTIYLIAYLLREFNNGLIVANLLVNVTLFWILLIYTIEKYKYNPIRHLEKLKSLLQKNLLINSLKQNIFTIIFFLICFVFISYLMISTFFIEDNKVYIGLTVFSDFAAHIPMIRSFSFGHNFPTIYPMFYQDEGGINYHFMFHFMLANLELLGLPLDWAINIPSILGVTSFIFLLYTLTQILFNKTFVSIVTVILFFFRPGMGSILYLIDIINYLNGYPINIESKTYNKYTDPLIINNIKIEDFLSAISNINFFIGKTLHEDWGLFSLKVYINQRHLAFALGILIIVLMFIYPSIKSTLENLSTIKKKKLSLYKKIKQIFQSIFFDKNAWIPKNIKTYLFLGFILGLTGFWNGAVLITGLLIISFLFIFCHKKLNLLVLILLSLALFYIQIKFFSGDLGAENTIKLNIGFLSEIPNNIKNNLNQMINENNLLGIINYSAQSIPYILNYLVNLLGLFLVFLVTYIIFLEKRTIILVASFIIPTIFAFTISLTIDINVNHKYILISIILLNMFIARFLYYLYQRTPKILFGIVFIVYISTGLIDLITIYNLNNKNKAMVFELDNQTYQWIINNTDKKSVFLTDYVSIHPVGFSGRYYFAPWPYYAWSAGYDTYTRDKIRKEIYEATDSLELKEMLTKNKINYVIIENKNRNTKDYKVNESIFINTFPIVFYDPKNNVYIFKVI